MTMSKKPKYERSDDYRYQYIRAHPGFMGKYYLCPYCGRIMLKKTMQVDHIVSISLANKHRAYRVLVPDGNINNLHNLTASCPKCNNRKSDSGGFWIFLARFGVVFYAVIWLLLLGFAAWFAIGAATGHIQRGFLLPYFSAAGNVLMQGTANAIASIFRFHNTQNLGQPVGKVTTTYNGEKIQVNVYADRSVILPDGTVRKVKQEVVDALIAKNQAMNPASTIVRMAPAKPRMTQPEPSQEQVQQPAARVQEPAQPSYQPQMQMPAQPQQLVMPQNAAVPEMQYQNEPVQQGYDTQMNAPADMPAQDIPAPLAQDPAAEQNASDKKQMFHKGKGKDKKNASADKKRGKAKAAPAEVQGEGFDGNMPVEKPKKKSKAGVIVAVVLAAVIGGGALGYAYVPAVYDGVNNVLTAVTGKQVGVPAPIPSNTGDGNAPTVSQPQLQQSSGTSENALNGIDLSGDVTIEFYATVRTADGREYKVPLSSANLTDGNLKSLLDGSGFTLTSGQ